MTTIGNIIGQVLKIADVIDGNKLNDDMINNILQIYFTEDLKKEFINLLDKYLEIFNKNIKNIQFLKPGTFILGPYSSGKSHIALFFAFLLGLDVNFSDDKKRKEIPNIREFCWNILENDSIFGKEFIKKYDILRRGNFLVAFVSLTNFIEQGNFINIIIKMINQTFDIKKIRSHIGIDITEKNKKIILDYLKESNETQYQIFNNLHEKEQKYLLEKIAESLDLELKKKTNEEIAQELNLICEENKIDGLVLFFDEFYRYYEIRTDDEKIKIGGVLQSLSYEIQNSVRMGILPISQIQIFDKDEKMKQIQRRFTETTLSHRNKTIVIHKRLIPNMNNSLLENFYIRDFIPNDKFGKRSLINFEIFKNFYPFHPKTIKCLEDFVPFYANDTKGIINYCKMVLKLYYNCNAENLITADTLYDYFISELESADSPGYELKEKFDIVEQNYFSKIKNNNDAILSRKILKIILFCTNRSITWSYQEFYDHFFDKKNFDIKRNIDELVTYVENHANFISKNIEGTEFYYNPGSSGDLNNYIKIIEKSLIKDRCINYFWNEKINDRYFHENSMYLKKFYWRKVIEKSVALLYVDSREKLGDIVSQTFNIINRYCEPEELISYKNVEDEFIDAAFLIGNPYYDDKDEISEYISTELNKLNVLNKEERNILLKSIFYIIPSKFSTQEENMIKNLYARLIVKKIFDIIKRERNIDWNKVRIRDDFQKYLLIVDETVIESNFAQFKKENETTIQEYIQHIEATLTNTDPYDIIKVKLLNNTNQKELFEKNLNNFWIYSNKSWIQIKDNIDNRIEYYISNLIEEKYPILSDLVVEGTKKLYNKTLMSILKSLFKSIYIESLTFTVTDNSTQQFLKTTYFSLDLIKEISRNTFKFNENIDNKYFSKFFEIWEEASKDKILNVNYIVSEYMKPPFGFPKVITLLMLISLVHMQKFVFIISKKQINLIYQYFGSDNNIETKLNAILKGKISVGNIIDNDYFIFIKKLLNTFFMVDNEKNMFNYAIFGDNNPKEYTTKLLTLSSLTISQQAQLRGFIRNLINFLSQYENLEKKIQDIHNDLINILLKLDHNIKNYTPIILDKILSIQNSKDIKDLIELIKKCNKEEYDDKAFLTELINRIKTDFLVDEKNEEKFFNNLTECWIKIGYVNINSDNIVVLRDSLKKIIEIEDFFKEFEELIFIKENIITYLKKYLINAKNFIDFLSNKEINKDPFLIETKNYINKVICYFKLKHKVVWSMISRCKVDLFHPTKDMISSLYLKLYNLLSEIKILNLNKIQEIDFEICSNDEYLNETDIIKNSGCNKCHLNFKKDFELMTILGFKILLNNLNFNKNGDQIINSNEIVIYISKRITEFIRDQLFILFKNNFSEQCNISQNILKNFIYEKDNIGLDNYNFNKEILFYENLCELLNSLNSLNRKDSDNLYKSILFLKIILDIIKSKSEFNEKYIKDLIELLENRTFRDYLNKILEVTIDPLSILKIKYGVYQLYEIVDLRIQDGLFNEIQSEIKQFYDSMIKENSNKLILSEDKINEIDNIQQDLKKINKYIPLVKLKKQRLQDKSQDTSVVNKDLIEFRNQLYIKKTELEDKYKHYLYQIFSRCYYIGSLQDARYYFEKLKCQQMDIYNRSNGKLKKIAFLIDKNDYIEEHFIK